MTSPLNLHDRLQRCIRRGRVLTSPAQLAGYDADGLGYKTYRPDAVVIPADAEELVRLLRQSRELNVPVTMRGAGTSLSGGPVAAQGGIVVHTSSLKTIRTIDPAGFWCEVESSVVLNQLDAALLPHGLFYPPDPSSGPVCTLGGNVAMNAGGAHCFRYGVTSNYVLGVEAVLLDGTVHRFGGPAGGRGPWTEDWKRLMVGSEGTLAAFTRFWLRLLPRPEKAWTWRATFASLQAAERAIQELAMHSSFPVAIELMDPRCVSMVENSPMAVGLPRDAFLLVAEIDGPAVLVDVRARSVTGLLQAAGATRVDFSDDDALRQRLWKARKVAGGLMGQLSPDFLVQDAVIPKSALAEVLQLVYDEADAAGLPAVNVFHAGDGNLHPNFLFDSRKPGELEKVEAISKRLMLRVVEVGGTLSGEHGIGNDKTAYMPLIFSDDVMRLQLAVPRIFNPRHQLNPLKVFASRQFEGHSSGASHRPAGKRPADDLFGPFLDPIDGVVCVPVSATADDLTRMAAPHRLRMPLMPGGSPSLQDCLKASPYTSASSRFGPWCDNLLGMNWKLPGGRVVRIGERVVKSTTGYDLHRFLLNSRAELGEPLDCVLRLRPDCGRSGLFQLTGPDEAVEAAVAAVLSTCWIHWFDAVDVLVPPDGKNCIQLMLNCPDEEWGVYAARVSSLASVHGLEQSAARALGSADSVLPDFVVKTLPDRAIPLASRLRTRHPVGCRVLCYNGVIHGNFHGAAGLDPAEAYRRVAADVSQDVEAIGGELHSRHLVLQAAGELERTWLQVLQTEFQVI